MSLPKQQHKILKVLYAHHLEYIKSEFKLPLGLNWQQISERTNVPYDQLSLVAARLVNDDEMISETDYTPLIYNITIPKGFAALANEKYLKEWRKNLIEEAKNIVSIVVPLLAVSLSFIIFLKSQTMLEQRIKR